jgi:hypothetical protein
VSKNIKINGVKVKAEMSEELSKELPNKIESSVKFDDKKLEHIARKVIVL